MMIDQLLNADQIKKLKSECKVLPASTNFEQICRVILTGLSLILDEAFKDLNKKAGL